jgi:chromosome segregation ATPase
MSSLSSPPTGSEKPNARTEAALDRLRKAMLAIEAEIAENNGIYPFNHGRVTQSELCRRADVKKATLQNPVHKDTTRVEIIQWLDEVASTLAQTRDGTRERVTEVADSLAAEIERLTQACQLVQGRLAEAQARIAELTQENAVLLSRLSAPARG